MFKENLSNVANYSSGVNTDLKIGRKTIVYLPYFTIYYLPMVKNHFTRPDEDGEGNN
jgi:hypothetical protein